MFDKFRQHRLIIIFIIWIIYILASFWYFYFERLYQRSELLKTIPQQTVIFSPNDVMNKLSFFEHYMEYYSKGFVFYLIDSKCLCSNSIELSKMIQQSKNNYDQLKHIVIDIQTLNRNQIDFKRLIVPSLMIFNPKKELVYYGYLSSEMQLCSINQGFNIKKKTSAELILNQLQENQLVTVPNIDSIVQGCFCNNH